jgi:hypothetical protein
MGNRFGDVIGYREDATLNPPHTARLQRILEEADRQRMAVLVGCLYWGHSRAKWESWSQKEAEHAVAETAAWLRQHDFRQVFLDTDNEGMACARAGFDNAVLIRAAQQAAPNLPVAVNDRNQAAPDADLHIHHSARTDGKPYVETEGSPPCEGGYWGAYSNPHPDEWYQYDHIGEYTTALKEAQLRQTFRHLDGGCGYFLASTWLQAAPPLGPNVHAGGIGTKNDPGIRWWLEAIRQRFDAWTKPDAARR